MKRSIVSVSLLLTAAGVSWGAAEEHIFKGSPGGGIRVHHQGYSFGYKTKYKAPLWVSYHLKPDYVNGKKALGGRPKLQVDSDLKKQGFKTPKANDFKSSGYWALSLFAHEDALGRGKECEKESYSLGNQVAMLPNKQTMKLWQDLSKTVRGWARSYGEVWVITGPVFAQVPERTSRGKIAIPTHFFKIVVRKDGGSVKTVAYKVPQGGGGSVEIYLTTVNEIEKLTGLDVLSAVPDQEEETAEDQRGAWDGSGGSSGAGNTAGGNTAGGNTSGGNTSGGNTSGGNTGGGNTGGGPVKHTGAVARHADKGHIWADTSLGLFYKSSHRKYGQGDGTYMEESNARMLGFKQAP